MCGIFGFVRKNKDSQIDSDIIRQLAMLNETRGRDSFGFFAESSFLKRTGTISSQYPETWVRQNDQSRYMGAHTRFATRGDVTRRNCHPFFFDGPAGTVIGIHNGVVPAPNHYTVDSEWIFDGIAQEGLEFLLTLDGYWGIAFVFNGEFYLAASNQELAFCIDSQDVLYFSSDEFHLQQATGLDCHEVDDMIIKIRDDFSFEVTELESRGFGYGYWYADDEDDYMEQKTWDNWKLNKKTKAWEPCGKDELVDTDYGSEWEDKEGLSMDWLDEDDAYPEFKKRFHQLSDKEWEEFEQVACK